MSMQRYSKRPFDSCDRCNSLVLLFLLALVCASSAALTSWTFSPSCSASGPSAFSDRDSAVLSFASHDAQLEALSTQARLVAAARAATAVAGAAAAPADGAASVSSTAQAHQPQLGHPSALSQGLGPSAGPSAILQAAALGGLAPPALPPPGRASAAASGEMSPALSGDPQLPGDSMALVPAYAPGATPPAVHSGAQTPEYAHKTVMLTLITKL